jgi:hypothetical protein
MGGIPMNGTPDHDRELTTTLQREADRFTAGHPTGLALDGVLARAGEIRRGRRMRASVVMAAVVAAAVTIPVGLWTSGTGTPDRPTPIASNGPAPTGPTLTLNGLATGAAPAAYISGRAVHAGGRTIPLGPGGAVDGFAAIDGGYLVARSDPNSADGFTVSFIGTDGTRLGVTWPTTMGVFAVSPSGNVGAFVEPDGTVIAVQDGGSRWFEVGKVAATSPGQVSSGNGEYATAVTGENCSGRSELPGCTIYVADTSPVDGYTTVQPHLTPVHHADGLSLPLLAADGRIAGQVAAPGQKTCSEIRSAAGAVEWRTCDYRPLAFAPDGRHLLVGAQNQLGPDHWFAVLDAVTHRVVLALRTPRNGFTTSYAWDGSEHLLIGVTVGSHNSVLRLGLDGSRELALPVTVAPRDYQPAYLMPST